MADIKENFENANDKIEKAQDKLEQGIVQAKKDMPSVTPEPPGFHTQSTAYELKSRLDWGEPALTILDVRDREAFNARHIMGAQAMEMSTLVDRAKSSLESNRDIYIYGADDAQTAEAAQMLRSAGFTRVSELKGGLSAFEEIHGSIEGTSTAGEELSAGAYNVFDRLKEYKEDTDKQKSMK